MSGFRLKLKKNLHRYQSKGDYSKAEIQSERIWKILGNNSLPLYPFTVEETVRKNRFMFREENCRFMIIAIMLEGNLKFQHNSKEYLLEPGKLLLIPQGTTYSFDSNSTGAYRKLVIEFSGTNLSSMSATLKINRFGIYDLSCLNEIIERIRIIRNLLLKKDNKQLPHLAGICYEFLVSLALAINEKSNENPIISKARQKLESDLNRPLSNHQLAADLGISETSLNRLFRTALKTSPQKYRASCKIELAKELLLHSVMSIKEIADKTGFCNQFHFSREFLSYTGEAPSLFRKKRTS